jgi:hypothetical protein
MNEYLIASGDNDGTWKIFDTRLVSSHVSDRKSLTLIGQKGTI